MGPRARAAALVLALGVAGTVACDGPRTAEAAHSPFEQLAIDSSAVDSAAFADLPPRLVQWMGFREYLDPAAMDALSLAVCDELPKGSFGERRRRLQMRLPDTSTVLLYAVANGEFGTLERVELIRRIPRVGQRGFTWTANRDNAQSVWWPEATYTRSRRVERGDIPRAGPIPRTLRAMGRQLYIIPCADSLTP